MITDDRLREYLALVVRLRMLQSLRDRDQDEVVGLQLRFLEPQFDAATRALVREMDAFPAIVLQFKVAVPMEGGVA